jgi:hypothetical protein
LLEDLTASGVVLSLDLMQKLDQLINERTVMGSRYNEQSNLEVDTEVFSHSV